MTSTTEVKTPLREVRMRVAVAFTILMLACDPINPVKILCDVLKIDPMWVGAFSLLSFLIIVCTNANELIYFMVKTFFHSILSIFFSSIEVLGKQNIPEHGPVIFTGNHMNQFVDGAVITICTPRKVGFLVAEKSMKKRIIGDFARACGSIPVSRPQDSASPGPGLLHFDGLRVVGLGTRFTALRKGEKIRPATSPEIYKIKEVLSDTEGILSDEFGEASPLLEKCQGQENNCKYDILASVDQSSMFNHVHTALASGQCLGIFPEGGSHDRTDLLPLKAGVAAIAFGFQEKFDISVPIVPVGLTYFRGHRFRGRVVVEFGEKIYIDKELLKVYKESKRQGYQQLLTKVEEGMRAVLITAPDYAELKLIHTVRRLYQRNATIMSTRQKQDLAKRFSVAYKLLRERYKDAAEGLPADIQSLVQHVDSYQQKLDQWGLRDYQLQHVNLQLSYSKLVYIFFHAAIVLLLSSFPSLILNAPVGAAAHFIAIKEAEKDLKASRVKLFARDVLLSKKIIISLVAVPVLWITYALLLLLFSPLPKRTVLVLFLCCPLFSYIGVVGVQGVMIDLKDLRPAFLRLLPSFKQHAHALPQERIALQQELRAIVKKYGPTLGALYYEKDPDLWDPKTSSVTNVHPLQSSSVAVTAQSIGTAANVADKSNNDADRSDESRMSRVTSLDQLASSIATTFRVEEMFDSSSAQEDQVGTKKRD